MKTQTLQLNAKRAGVCLAAGALVAASMLSYAALSPSQALATTADTKVVANYDNSRLNVTAPVLVDLAVMADGTLLAPDASSLQIINHSPFRAHVSEAGITPASPYNFVDEGTFASTSEQHSVWMNIQPNDKTKLSVASQVSDPAIAHPDEWILNPTGNSEDKINLAFTGAIKNAYRVPVGAPTELYTVNWTFCAGVPEV